MSDTYSSDAPSFGGVPANYASPEQMQRAYFNLLRNRNRQQKALSAYYHPLAAVADVVEAASDQLQINRMMGAARQSTEAGAATVPDLPPILSGDADTPSVGHPDQPPQGQFSPTTNHADIGQQPTDPHLDPKFANAVMQIESRGDVNARSGSNRGLFQWSPDLERRYGINDQNRTDPTAQYRAFNRANVDYHGVLNKNGLEPTPGNAYLVHQQGMTGGPALMKADENMPAWQAIAPFYGSEKRAKQAITGNLWPGMAGHGLPAEQVTAGMFRGTWNDKINSKMGGAPSTMPGQPQATSAPQAAAPPGNNMGTSAVEEAAGATPGQSPMLVAQAAPGSVPQATPALPGGPQQFMPPLPGAREQMQKDIDAARNMQRSLDPAKRAEGIRLEGEIRKGQQVTPSVDPNTGYTYSGSDVTGRKYVPGIPKQPLPWEVKGMEETAKGEAGAKTAEITTAQKTMTGIRGLGVTGSTIEPYANAALKIVNDPSFKQTGLVSQDNQLWFERVKKQLGFAQDATPLAVLNQIRNTSLNAMQSGAKSMSTEGGEASRLFATELEPMKGELPAANATAEEQIAGWNSVLRRAKKWGDDSLYFNDWQRKQPNGLPHSGIHDEIIGRNRSFQPFDEGFEKGAPGAAPTPGQPAPGAPMQPMSGAAPAQAVPSFNDRFSAAGSGFPAAPAATPAPTYGGPGTTRQARTGIGLPAAVPPAGPMSTYTSDVTARAKAHPEGLPLAMVGGAVPPAVALAGRTMMKPALKAILEALGIGTGIAATEHYWK